MSEEQSRTEQEEGKMDEEPPPESATQQEQQQLVPDEAADEPRTNEHSEEKVQSVVDEKSEDMTAEEAEGEKKEEGGEGEEGDEKGDEGEREEEGESKGEEGERKGEEGDGNGEEGESKEEGGEREEEDVKEEETHDQTVNTELQEGEEEPATEVVVSDGKEETAGGREEELGEATGENGGADKQVEGGVEEGVKDDMRDEGEVILQVQDGDDEASDSRGGSASRAPLENITEEEEEEEVDREELIKNCREALDQQRRLRSGNAQLQHKIAEYLSHKSEEKPDPGRNVTDQEKRYIQCMSALEQLEVELQQMRVVWSGKEEEMRGLCDIRLRGVQGESGEFLKYQAEGAKEAVDSRTGRKLTPSDITRLQAVQNTNDQAVFQARLENIKLTNKIERLESLLKQKEELAEGLHMIDFEQLKISNVDLGEKVEERNEDIGKLTGKVRATVQVLTHVKEKLHFLQDENEKKKELLEQLDSDLAKRRDMLTRLKQARDSLRLDNQRLRQRGGLVCHTDLLRDFEDRQDQNAEFKSELERLQSQHSHNGMQCAGLRRKIEHTRHLQHHLH